MNYIDEDTAFERWCENNYLPIRSQAIWKKLFKRFNRSGWCEWVTVDNPTLMAEVQIRRDDTFVEYRDKLIEAGLIEYIKGKKGSPNRYKLISFEKYTFTSGVQTGVESVVNTVVQTGVESVVQTGDINKQDKTKQNSKRKKADAVTAAPAVNEGYQQIIGDFSDDPAMQTALWDYIQMRVMKKKAPTDKALQLVIKHLGEMSSDPAVRIAILNQSTIEGWTDIYPLKEKSVKASVSPLQQQQPAKRNRFANFQQRDNDYAALERQERDYLAQEAQADAAVPLRGLGWGNQANGGV